MEITELVMPGSTEQNFITRFVADWFETTPNAATFAEISAEIDGISRWHRVICSTPPPWLNKSLAGKINREMIRIEAQTSPWFRAVADRDMSVFDRVPA